MEYRLQRSAGRRALIYLCMFLTMAALSCEFASGQLTTSEEPDGGQALIEEEVEAPAGPATAAIQAPHIEEGVPRPGLPSAGDPEPPQGTVKLIFIHHSCGENWLADEDGGLGLALMDNHYFVSDTNYGWGPNGIGDRTDFGDWPEWFLGPESQRYLEELYTYYDNYSGIYSRGEDPDPGRENQVVLFKSCYPNSNLEGDPDDPPAPGDPATVGGAKSIYVNLLSTFASRPDKLFIAITAPPVGEDDSWAPPANTRAFNNWLVHDWLAGYPLNNVAVFDFYNVLSSNGGDRETSDVGAESGNHHRWWQGAVQHLQTVNNDLAAYPTDDSHPSSAGNRKATAEFVPLLNVYVNRWLSATEPPAAELPAVSPGQAGDFSTPLPGLIASDDLVYLGAFRLPDGQPAEGDEYSWAWGGDALAYYPDGDPDEPGDGFPGSLFGTGHDWRQLVSEITIPVPVWSQDKNLAELNTADTLQSFHDIRSRLFGDAYFEVARAGLAYLPPQDQQESGMLYSAWGQHFHDGPPAPSHGWSEVNLADPETAGPWLLDDFSNYSTTDYLMVIAEEWAALNTPGKRLAAGRFRDGGWSGQGPSLIAYGPWNEGNPPSTGSRLEAVPLLLYDSTLDGETADPSHTLRGYHHADEWSGGAWLTAGGRSAVIFAGTKGLGDCWYGFANGLVWPDEPPYPEVPAAPDDDRGWWSSEFEGQILFYDPAQLAAVARGDLAPFQPQPYALLQVDSFLFNIRSRQQKHHLGAVTFDAERGLLYIFEPLVDEDKPIVHVWRVEP